ncbi:MAG: PAS domain S-box protein [Opitutaceae bacterium]|nr:PAS domain S-box protein [Opitutaceae bacterium]
MNPNAPLRATTLADQILAVDVFSELLASTDPQHLGRRLTEQLRELTGARTVALLAHPETGAPHTLIHVCPERRATLFSGEELGLFCPECSSADLPAFTALLPLEHPLRPVLQRAGVESLLRVPLRVQRTVLATLLLLDFPEPHRIQEAATIVAHLSPVIALALKNAFTQERLAQQARALQDHTKELERRVGERTAALEAANKSFAASRFAALNLMEDAVAARQRLENANIELQREIAERTRAEETLRQTQQRLELAQRAAGAGVWDWDMTTDRLQWSPELFVLFGLDPTRSQASLDTWQQLIHPDDREPATRRLEAAIREDTLLESEYRVILPDGRIRWIFAVGRTTYDAERRPVRMAGICLDITARKTTEAALQHSEALFRSTFDEAPVGAAIVGLDQTFQRVNAALCRFLGFPAEELLRRTFPQITHPDDVVDSVANVRRLLGGEVSAFEIEKRYLRAGGEVVWGRVSVSLVRDAAGRPLHFLPIIQDITARKRAEAATEEAERFIRSTIDALDVHLCVLDENGVILTTNRAWDRFSESNGGTPERTGIGANYLHACDGAVGPTAEGAAGIAAGIRSVLAGSGATFAFEYPCDGPDVHRWFTCRVTAFNTPGALRVVVAHENITERECAERALKESERRYATTLTAVNDGLWEWHVPSGNAYFGPGYYGMLGYADGAFVANYTNWRTLVHPDDIERVETNLRESVGTSHGFAIDLRMKTKAGSWLWVSTRGNTIEHDSDGKALRMAGTLSDITQRKQAEAELEQFFALVPDMVCIASGDGRFQKLNDAWMRVLGYSKAELMAVPYAEFVHPDDCESTVRETDRLASGAATSSFINRYRAKDGSYRWLEWNATATNENGMLFAAARDITEHRQAEQAVRESELRYRTLANSGPGLVWTSGLDKKCNYFNQTWLAFTGRRLEQELGDGWVEGVHPDDLQRCVATYATAFDRREHFSMDYRLRHHTGEYRWIQDDGSPRFDSQGEFLGYIGHCLDITERKQAAEIIAWEAALVDNSSDICCVKDLDLRVRAVNSAFVRAARATSASQVLGKTDAEIAAWPGNEANIESYLADERRAQTLAPGESILREEQAMLPDGSMRHLLTRKFPVFDPGGRLIATASISTDITERKRAEDDRRRSHELLAKLTAQVPGVVYQYRLFPDGRSCFPFSSPGMQTIYEYNPEEVREDATPVFGRLHPEDAGAVSAAILESARTLAPFHCEFRVVLPRQGLRWRLSDAMPERTEDGGTLWHGIISDITERKRAEDALHESEQHHRLLIQHLHAGVVVHAPDTRILLANEQASILLGLSIDQMLGKTAIDPAWCFLHEDGSPVPLAEYPVNRVRTSLEPVRNLVLGIHRPDASRPVWVLINGFPDLDGRGELSQVVVTFVDITERRRTEVALRDSLREKESLLREVHHRVKNNLQIISSLLRLQAGQIDHPATSAVLHDMQGRIRSMALLHETLYRSGNLAQVDLADYLQTVCTQSLRASSRREPAAAIRLEFNLASVFLDATRAVPCGLLVNELVSNCLKHAFPGDRGGTVRVSLQPARDPAGSPPDDEPPPGGAVPACDPAPSGGAGFAPAISPRSSLSPESLRLTVSDNGVGLPPGFDLAQLRSLGLQLVSDLARQLQGRLEIGRGPDNGASFTVIFAPSHALVAAAPPPHSSPAKSNNAAPTAPLPPCPPPPPALPRTSKP